jgi:phenylacetate-CoA ligase
MNPFLARNMLYKPVVWLRREPVSAALRQLRQTQWLPPDRLAEWQWDQLRVAVVRAVKCVPLYADLMRGSGLTASDLKSPADLTRLPTLTKATLRAQQDSLLCREYRGPVTYKTTGGSTGEAVTIVKDRVASAFARGAAWRNYEWWGIRIGERQARFWGIPVTRKQRLRYRLIDLISNRIRLASFNFSDVDLLSYYERIRRFAPAYLYGYASMIYGFAAFLKENRLTLSVPNVITTAEVLYPAQRRVIQEVLHCNVIDEYGCGEVGPIAFECPAGRMHLMADNVYVEILMDDGSEARPGEIGEVVVTELHSHAMPLIRYRIGDYVEVGDNHCPCGRGLPVIRRVIGRTYDYLLTKDGRRFHGEKVMYLLERLQEMRMGVKQMQVIQTSIDELRIKMTPDSDFRPRALNHIETYFVKALGPSVRIEYQMVDQIPREPSGKMRIVACSIAQ